MRLQKRKLRGFTLVEILIVVAIIGVLLAIAFPNYMKTRTVAQTNICIENLTQMESAKQIWGVEKGKKNGDPVADEDLFGPLLYMKRKPECPAGGEYDLMSVGENSECSLAAQGHKLGE